MYELSLSLWSILCIEEVWSDSSVQKIQEVQHASLAAVRRFDQNFHHVSSDVENLTELKAAVKWACESSAEQNEDSDQHSHLHHSFHLKCHFCQCMSDLQCNCQININSWSSYLTSDSQKNKRAKKNSLKNLQSE